MAKGTKVSVSVLDNWNDLCKAIMEMDEAGVAWLAEQEKAGRGRLTVMLRLNARLSKLRRERERAEIAKGAK